MKLRKVVCLCVVLGAASAAGASMVDEVVISEWAGDPSGANTAYMVIDFGPESFAFGVLFDESISGWDLLTIVDNESELLEVDADFFEGIGWFLNSITYNGIVGDEFGTWWSYWVSTNGENWSFSENEGASARMVGDGDWDGWSWSDGWPPVPGLDTPVPEPMTLGLLAGGVMMLRLRRKLS